MGRPQLLCLIICLSLRRRTLTKDLAIDPPWLHLLDVGGYRPGPASQWRVVRTGPMLIHSESIPRIWREREGRTGEGRDCRMQEKIVGSR